MKHRDTHTDALILPAGKGRDYNCGTMTAIFKIHDFKNQTHRKTGVLNFFVPGGFERNMPTIVKWFEDSKRH